MSDERKVDPIIKQVSIVKNTEKTSVYEISALLSIGVPIETFILWQCWNYAASDWAWAPQITFWKAMCLCLCHAVFARKTFPVRSHT